MILGSKCEVQPAESKARRVHVNRPSMVSMQDDVLEFHVTPKYRECPFTRPLAM